MKNYLTYLQEGGDVKVQGNYTGSNAELIGVLKEPEYYDKYPFYLEEAKRLGFSGDNAVEFARQLAARAAIHRGAYVPSYDITVIGDAKKSKKPITKADNSEWKIKTKLWTPEQDEADLKELATPEPKMIKGLNMAPGEMLYDPHAQRAAGLGALLVSPGFATTLSPWLKMLGPVAAGTSVPNLLLTGFKIANKSKNILSALDALKRIFKKPATHLTLAAGSLAGTYFGVKDVLPSIFNKDNLDQEPEVNDIYYNNPYDYNKYIQDTVQTNKYIPYNK